MSDFADSALAFDVNIRDAVMAKASVLSFRSHMKMPAETHGLVTQALQMLAEGRALPENPLGKALKDCIECHVDAYESGIAKYQQEKLAEKGVKTPVFAGLSRSERSTLASYILWSLLDDLKRIRTGVSKAELQKAETAFSK